MGTGRLLQPISFSLSIRIKESVNSHHVSATWPTTTQSGPFWTLAVWEESPVLTGLILLAQITLLDQLGHLEKEKDEWYMDCSAPVTFWGSEEKVVSAPSSCMSGRWNDFKWLKQRLIQEETLHSFDQPQQEPVWMLRITHLRSYCSFCENHVDKKLCETC